MWGRDKIARFPGFLVKFSSKLQNYTMQLSNSDFVCVDYMIASADQLVALCEGKCHIAVKAPLLLG